MATKRPRPAEEAEGEEADVGAPEGSKRARRAAHEGGAQQQGKQQQQGQQQQAGGEDVAMADAGDAEMGDAGAAGDGGQQQQQQQEHQEEEVVRFSEDNTVFVRGLPAGTQDADLERLFQQCGPLKRVRMPKHPATGEYRVRAYMLLLLLQAWVHASIAGMFASAPLLVNMPAPSCGQCCSRSGACACWEGTCGL